MQVYVYSRAMIEAIAPQEVPHLMISITSGPGDRARLREGDLCRGVLRLVFVDADQPSSELPEELLFSREQAREIWRFVKARPSDVTRIVVHCDAGISRSAGTAAALAKLLRNDDSEFFGGRYRPNMRVYRGILEAAQEGDS